MFSLFNFSSIFPGGRKGIRRVKKLEWWGTGVVICLERGADLHMIQRMPLQLTVSCFSKIQIGFSFWYRLIRVVPDKGPLNGCVCVCVFQGVHLPLCADAHVCGLEFMYCGVQLSAVHSTPVRACR